MAEIAALETERRAVDDRRRDAQIRVDDLTLEQRRADQDVEQVKARRQRDRDRMERGLVTNPKDLERMQHELVSLERRIATLEDAELEVMEQLEEALAQLARLTEELAAIDVRLDDLRAARDEKVGALDAEAGTVEAQRGPLVERLPADLVALYDRLREQKGSGAAELRGRACGGCRLTLDHLELGRIKALPVDEVVRCEECSRILVRTPESGL
nr:C4-type zinc ribbon domain-containing protein [Nocardioides perillae]